MRYKFYSLNRQRGMALICVLLLMMVFALFSWCAWENNLLEMKMINASWRKHQLVAAGRQQLAVIEQRLPGRCRVQAGFVSHLLYQSLATWQQLSCAGNFQAFLYYYVIEPMGNAACVYLGNASVDYYRITLLIVDDQHVELRTVLQSTLVQASVTGQVCHGKIRSVVSGRQTFRILL